MNPLIFKTIMKKGNKALHGKSTLIIKSAIKSGPPIIIKKED